MLSDAQLPTLKTAILAETDPTFVTYRTNGQNGMMADWFNQIASPDFIVIKSSLSRHEILTGTSLEGTVFTWTAGAYITRSQGERDAFREMFNSTGAVDPRLPTITAAFNDIFSGTGGATNRTHCTAMSKRKAKKGEKLFATGTGSLPSPGALVFEGDIVDTDISRALA